MNDSFMSHNPSLSFPLLYVGLCVFGVHVTVGEWWRGRFSWGTAQGAAV